MNYNDLEEEKEHYIFLLNSNFDNLLNSEIKELAHYIFRYRKKEYIEKKTKESYHFEKQILNLSDPTNFISFIDSSVNNKIGRDLFNMIHSYKNFSEQQNWIKKKTEYEDFFTNKSYFIPLDNLKNIEIIFIYR